MKHFLLLGMAAALLGGNALAQGPAVKKMNMAENAFEQLRATKKGKLPIKRMSADVLSLNSKSVNPKANALSPKRQAPRKNVAKSQQKDGYVFYENFSDWDGEDWFWVPEGWTVEHYGDCSWEDGWLPQMANPWLGIEGVDGDNVFGILYSMDQQDEWLITPEVEVGADMELSYWFNLDPFWFYSTENVDWDLWDYVGDKIITYTFQVMIQEEGGEWVMLRDYAQEYLDYTFDELYEMSNAPMQKQTISLAEYANKKVKVGFRYLGTDGNSIFIDAVGIGYAPLENVVYMSPLHTLYYGLTNDETFSYLTNDYAFYPVYAPTTWINMSEDEATYTWTYNDPETGEEVTSDDQDELSVTYVPDYRSEASLKNNFFYAPTLKAENAIGQAASYTAPYKAFQAGGKAERNFDGIDYEFSLLQFAPDALGLGFVDVRDDSQGAYSVPVFGYNEFTDQYWLNYSLGGEEPIEGDYSHLIGIANLFVPSDEADIVAKGISVYGWGRIFPEAQLTATIYALDEEWHSDISTFTKIASATISGDQVLNNSGFDAKDYLFLPFVFDEPVAFRATDEHPAYVFMLEGFNSEYVEYFAPLQSVKPAEFDYSFGYMLNKIDVSAHTGGEPYYSFKSIRYIDEDGEYVFPTGGFTIGLLAEYPWLTADVEQIIIGEDAEEATAALGSYYDGSQLTVEAPAGLTATVAGRYNECVLTVARTSTEAVEGNVVVKGPGVEVTIPVKADLQTGISEINAEAGVKAIYDLSGRQVDATTQGVYIVKYNDGTVRKVTVK